METREEFKALFQETLEEMETDIQVNLEDLSRYASERLTHLSGLVGQPGYEAALRAERDGILLRAGLKATRQADATDQRIVGLVQGAMRIGAVALAAA